MLPLSILGSIWYVSTNRIIEHNAANYSQTLVEQTSKYIDAYLSELDRIVVPFLLNPSIQDFMHLEKDDYYGKFLLEKRIRKEFYMNLFSSRPDISQFVLIKNEDTSPFTSDDYSLGGLRSYDHYFELLNSDTATTDFTIEGLNYGRNGFVVTAYKTFQNPLQKRSKGILVIDLKLDKFIEICTGLKFNEQGQAYLIDHYERYVYHPEKEKIGTFVDDQTRARLFDEDNISGTSQAFVSYTDDQMQTYHVSPFSGWTILFELSLSSLTADLQKIRTGAIVIIIIFAVITLIWLGGFSYRLISSLSYMQKSMKRVEIGDLEVRAPEQRKDEIGILFHSFNRMVSEQERLKSIEHSAQLQEKEMQVQQRETRLAVLQSQINPHFLYNTLGSIHSYAILANVEPISQMAANLATIFRYSMDDSTELVSLWQEMKYIRPYLDIQKMRFAHLQVELDLGEENLLQQIPCARLVLQPLVENAMQHGYEEHGLQPGYIAIVGHLHGEDYQLQLIDRGGGMQKEVMDRLNDAFASSTIEQLTMTQQSPIAGSIGLWNVHVRLRLLFGHPYGANIVYSNETGTMISLLMPRNQKSG